MEHSESVINFIESQGDTTYKVAKATGISESTFSKWRSKPTSKIDTTILEKIADYYHVQIDKILGRGQKNKPAAESDGLTKNEREFIRKFRRLNSLGKKLADSNMDALLNLQDKKVL